MSREIKAFDDVFEDLTSKATKIKKVDYLKMGEFPIIDQGQNFIAGYCNDSKGLFKDVPVIAFGDHTRCFKYIDFPMFIGADGVKVLKAKDKNNDAKYLYYFLTQLDFIENGYDRHFKYLKRTEIVLPDSEIQKKITEVLDKIYFVIEKRKAQIAVLDKLAKDTFIDMFGDPTTNPKGWPIVPFLRVASIDTRMTKEFDSYAECFHIGIENIEKETGTIIDPIKVKDSGLISGKYEFDERHIIYSKIRPNLNKVALPNFKGLCSADSYPILPKEEVCNREYLAFLLRSQLFLKYILGFSGRTNIPKVNKKQVSGFELPLAPFEMQLSYAKLVAKIEKQKKQLHESLTVLETTFRSTMQKAFTGELF